VDCVAESSPFVAALADRPHTTLIKVSALFLLRSSSTRHKRYCCKRLLSVRATSVLLAREAGGQPPAALTGSRGRCPGVGSIATYCYNVDRWI